MTDTPSLNTHEQVSAELGAYALGALEPVDAQRVEQHVSTCSMCAAELADLQTVLREMPPAASLGKLDQHQSNKIRERLVEKARAGAVSSRQSAPWRTIAIAAGLAFLAAGLGYVRERARTGELQQLYAQRETETRTLAAAVRDKELQIAAMSGPDVTVMEMSSTGVNAPSARMFWDRATNRWTVFAHGLARPKAGRAYELWLVTADRKIPAGVFKPSEDGSAVFTATYALSSAELKAIAVTEEPESGVSAPTGSIVLLGSAPGS